MVDLAGQAKALLDGIEAALPAWVVGSVERVYRAWAGPLPPEVAAAAGRAADEAVADVGLRVRGLLEADIDEQGTTPLALLRTAVAYPTAVLRSAGVPPVVRDPVDEAMFPGDAYGLAPATFADLDPGLVDAGVGWGAAKAWEHRRRHGGGSSGPGR
ncbi:MAG TPA: hypothetical protein VGI06_17445 [Acidimicrobiales bacterium]